MCFFVETHYPVCKHTCFELHIFCREVLRQLDRINDPEQREMYDLPFDDCAGCEPYTVIVSPAAVFPNPGMNYASTVLETNIMRRLVDMEERCPSCRMNGP
ncbi:hypothetical protein N7457_009191 [Penicillium paradoxum]|uniref:uncharacterized protein n=1 Tax=Penicillium paradoxum TaxID=176176 RepID=UPI002548344A|nr:uncharacterized protein N7457_009191 [Penicillium paradoxum]KAJ5774295.1 hypothetical protein N7457_009191 [Penicillium paradoxum]